MRSRINIINGHRLLSSSLLICRFERSFVEQSNLIFDRVQQQQQKKKKNAAPAVRMSPSSIDVSGGPEQLSLIGR